ncbi:hypothetical protein BN1723_020759, partial [Verticillium longisporum]
QGQGQGQGQRCAQGQERRPVSYRTGRWPGRPSEAHGKTDHRRRILDWKVARQPVQRVLPEAAVGEARLQHAQDARGLLLSHHPQRQGPQDQGD